MAAWPAGSQVYLFLARPGPDRSRLPPVACRPGGAYCRAVLPSVVIANPRATLGTVREPRRGIVVTNTVVYDPNWSRPATGIPNEVPFGVGMIGRLANWKGQDLFLEAFARAFPDDGSEALVVGSAMFGEDQTYADTLHAQVQQGSG